MSEDSHHNGLRHGVRRRLAWYLAWVAAQWTERKPQRVFSHLMARWDSQARQRRGLVVLHWGRVPECQDWRAASRVDERAGSV